jgi:hypothetical protein
LIDIGTEQLVSLHEVPRLLPARGSGKRIHISAVYRWVQRGIRGTRLEVIRVGGTTYTSREALQRFAAPPVSPNQPARPESPARQKQIDQAIKSLDEFLYKGKRRPGRQPVVPQQPLDRPVRETGRAPAPPR